MTKKNILSISLCLIILWIVFSFVAGKGTEVASYDKEPVRILIDAGHGGKYLRQKNKKDLCGRTG